MSRVTTFSRFFPKGHPKEQQPTFFVEKICKGLVQLNYAIEDCDELALDADFDTKYYSSEKWHTIRKGLSCKVGDQYSPRVWSGQPYRSKQIILCKAITITNVWRFDIDIDGYFYLNLKRIESEDTLIQIARNDGLSDFDFVNWFKLYKLPFAGQIRYWNPSITYNV